MCISPFQRLCECVWPVPVLCVIHGPGEALGGAQGLRVYLHFPLPAMRVASPCPPLHPWTRRAGLPVPSVCCWTLWRSHGAWSAPIRAHSTQYTSSPALANAPRMRVCAQLTGPGRPSVLCASGIARRPCTPRHNNPSQCLCARLPTPHSCVFAIVCVLVCMHASMCTCEHP